MQKQVLNLDGTQKNLSDVTGSNQSLIDNAIAASSDGDGYHVIIGTDLDQAHPSARTASVVASQGVLVFCALDTE